MIILSFDFGTKNIGVAIGQLITLTAQPIDTIKVKKNIPNWIKVSFLISIWKPKLIIIGYPLNMDGTNQKIIKKVKKFSQSIKKKFLIDVKLYDERLTTKEAKSIIFEQGGYKNLKKNKIDSISAALILESWLYNYKMNKKKI